MKCVVAASVAAILTMSGTAFAVTVPCTTSTSGTCVINDGGLSAGNPIGIQDSDVESGAYDATGSFGIDPALSSASAIADVTFDGPAGNVPAGFSNLTVNFLQDGMSVSGGPVTITNPDGTTPGGSVVQFMLSFLSDSDVFFEIMGDAFLVSGGSLPDYNINLTANAVPLPGALPLLLAGLAGLGFSMRKRADA